jgi:hypothetical protein
MWPPPTLPSMLRRCAYPRSTTVEPEVAARIASTVDVDGMPFIDLVVVGSVAVNDHGARLGKGVDYAGGLDSKVTAGIPLRRWDSRSVSRRSAWAVRARTRGVAFAFRSYMPSS